MSEQQPPVPPPAPVLWQPPPTNGHATASLVLGVVSLVGCSFLTGIPAVVFGQMARREIAASGGRQGGADLATVGIVLGLVATVLGVLVVLGVLLVYFFGLVVFDVRA